MYTYGFVGSGTEYEYLKAMHEASGLYKYERFDLSTGQAEQLIESADYKAINLCGSICHKAVRLCDELSPTAAELQCVDTVIVKDNRIYGHNAVYHGLKYILALSGVDVSGKRVMVLGRYFSGVDKALGMMGAVVADKNPDVIIKNAEGEQFSFDGYEGVMLAADLIGTPIRSGFLIEAAERGIKTTDGIDFYAGSAIRSIELFGGALSDADRLRRIVLNRFRNIVLTGMPLSGKSTVARLLERATGKRFVDTDAAIEKRANMPITRIFQLYGEEYFRKLERDAIKYLSGNQGIIIATGGGAVMNEENWKNLMKNGRIYCLKRDVEFVSSKSRPLSSDTESYKKLYEERKDTYKARCDVEIENNASPEDAVNKILEDFYEVTDN